MGSFYPYPAQNINQGEEMIQDGVCVAVCIEKGHRWSVNIKDNRIKGIRFFMDTNAAKSSHEKPLEGARCPECGSKLGIDSSGTFMVTFDE